MLTVVAVAVTSVAGEEAKKRRSISVAPLRTVRLHRLVKSILFRSHISSVLSA